MKRRLTAGENAILTWLLLPQEIRFAYLALFSSPLPNVTWKDWATCAANGYTEKRVDTTVNPPRFRVMVTDAGLEALYRHYRTS